jgi:hypothetical protein
MGSGSPDFQGEIREELTPAVSPRTVRESSLED